MKAVWNNKIIAEADKDKLIYIEGNWYFPPNSIKKNLFSPTERQTFCRWKGEANYFDVNVDGETNQNSAWYYPVLLPAAKRMVKKDFTDYVAFWNGIEIKE